MTTMNMMSERTTPAETRRRNSLINAARRDFAGNAHPGIFDDMSSEEVSFWGSFETPYDELDASRGERFDDAPQ